MSGDRPAGAEQRCIELVELLTAYLDAALDPSTRADGDEDLEGCAGCRAALAQLRTVAGLAGRLTAADVADLDQYVRERLLAMLTVPRRR